MIMKISIKRENGFVEYSVELENPTLLDVLNSIKTKQDNTLTFSSGCRSSVCGSCSMRVNEVEVLACSYKVQDGDRVEPLRNAKVLRDLIVDMDKSYAFNAKAKAWLSKASADVALTQEQEKINEVQSDCILCGNCVDGCPKDVLSFKFIKANKKS